MLSAIDYKINFLVSKEASLTEAGCIKRNEFFGAALALTAMLNQVLTSQET